VNISHLQQIVKNYLFLIKERWRPVALFAILGGILMGLYSLTLDPTFVASATFHPEKGKKQSISLDPVAALLGSSFQASGTDEMIGVLKSRTLSEKVSADSVVFQGKKWLMADLILEYTPKDFSIKKALGLQKKKTPSLEEKIYQVGRKLRSVFKVTTNDNGFMVMSYSFYNHDLTGLVCDKYIDNLLEYYKNQKIEKALLNKVYYQEQADSVKTELDNASYAVARFYDSNKYRTQLSTEVKARQMEAKVKWLSEIYTQLLLQLEQAKSQIQQDTPVIQILDPPEPPFDMISTSKFKLIFIGLFFGAFVCAVYVTRKQLKEDLGDLINYAFEENKD
jgi:uncharacterized protein involved in exopolysaccharide biosynthesis